MERAYGLLLTTVSLIGGALLRIMGSVVLYQEFRNVMQHSKYEMKYCGFCIIYHCSVLKSVLKGLYMIMNNEFQHEENKLDFCQSHQLIVI